MQDASEAVDQLKSRDESWLGCPDAEVWVAREMSDVYIYGKAKS